MNYVSLNLFVAQKSTDSVVTLGWNYAGSIFASFDQVSVKFGAAVKYGKGGFSTHQPI